MRTIGSRELKANLGKVLKQVRENEEVYVITHHGRRVARLIPEDRAGTQAMDFETIWEEMDRLAEEIAQEWPVKTPPDQAVSLDRREL
jgi:prevent-host-death family protein